MAQLGAAHLPKSFTIIKELPVLNAVKEKREFSQSAKPSPVLRPASAGRAVNLDLPSVTDASFQLAAWLSGLKEFLRRSPGVDAADRSLDAAALLATQLSPRPCADERSRS